VDRGPEVSERDMSNLVRQIRTITVLTSVLLGLTLPVSYAQLRPQLSGAQLESSRSDPDQMGRAGDTKMAVVDVLDTPATVFVQRPEELTLEQTETRLTAIRSLSGVLERTITTTLDGRESRNSSMGGGEIVARGSLQDNAAVVITQQSVALPGGPVTVVETHETYRVTDDGGCRSSSSDGAAMATPEPL
jgi:hypothetical protein